MGMDLIRASHIVCLLFLELIGLVLVVQRLDGLDDHEVEQRTGDLGCSEDRSLTTVVVSRSNLNDICTNDLKPFQAFEDGNELSTGPAAWLRGSSGLTQILAWFPLWASNTC